MDGNFQLSRTDFTDNLFVVVKAQIFDELITADKII